LADITTIDNKSAGMDIPKKKGTVYLIGAGPGDPGLITLRGKELIEKADILVYDHLANPELLSYAPDTAQMIYVGKEASKHTLKQDKINLLIAESAKSGKMVIRLKGGDPFIFGRGGEEAEYLASQKVPFEIVPGVTSAIAVPAYAGIPLTHRDYTTSVAFITGHEKPDKEKSTIPWKELATGPKTLVFLMGVRNLPLICQELISKGRAPETPAAVIQWGTLNTQRTAVGNLLDITRRVEDAKIKPPSIILIGEVIRLREQLKWFENRPLFGKKIVVTRSRPQASQLVGLLKDLGADVLEYPTISIRMIDPNPALERAIKGMKQYQWIIFTSANGVSCLFYHIEKMLLDTRILSGIKIAAIGPATADELKIHGIRADMIPVSYKAEGVIEGLLSLEDIRGKRILIPRAETAREILPEELEKKGAQPDVLPVYKTLPDERANTAGLVKELEEGKVSMITFTSSSTVNNFFSNLEGKIAMGDLMGVAMACIGPITENTLNKKGFSATVTPENYTIPDLVCSILEYYTKSDANNLKKSLKIEG